MHESCHQCKGGCRKHSGDSESSGSKIISWPASPAANIADPEICNVQIAIEDQIYAGELRALLEADGKHRALVVTEPDPAVSGVMVLDETTVGQLAVPEGRDAIRYFVLCNEESDPSKLWQAGVRRLLPAKHPLEFVRFAILYTELLLSQEHLPA